MNIDEKAKRIFEEEAALFRFKGTHEIRKKHDGDSFSGSITLIDPPKVHLGYRADYEKDAAKALEHMVADPFDASFRSLTRHEFNHRGGGTFTINPFSPDQASTLHAERQASHATMTRESQLKGCPRNIDLHAEKILEYVARTFQQLGFADYIVTPEQTLYQYMANIIEDLVDNSELGAFADHFGMFTTYHDQVQGLKKETIDADGNKITKPFKWEAMYTSFIKLQQIFYGGKRSHELLSPYYSTDDAADAAVEAIMDRTGLATMQKLIHRGKRRRRKRNDKTKQVLDRKRAVRWMTDEENWPELTRIVVEEFAKMLDKEKLEEQDEEYKKMVFILLKGEDDIFRGDMNDDETLMKFVMKKFLKDKKEHEDDEERDYESYRGGSTWEPPAWIPKNKALDLVYQRFARNLVIKTKSASKTTTMPVMRYGRREYDPRKDKLSKARPYIKNGKLAMRSKRFTVEKPIEYQESVGPLPPVRFLIGDDSASMQGSVTGGRGTVMNPWAPRHQQWTDTSKYHYRLIAEWSLYEMLRQHGALKHTSVKSAAFSEETRLETNLAKAKEQALNPSFGGDTLLDMDKLLKAETSQKELILSMSDGHITNWNRTYREAEYDDDGNLVREQQTVGQAYVEMAKRNYFCHIQIGDVHRDPDGNIMYKNKVCQDLEAAGCRVVYDDGRNLGKIVIDFTRPFVAKQR